MSAAGFFSTALYGAKLLSAVPNVYTLWMSADLSDTTCPIEKNVATFNLQTDPKHNGW